MGLNDTPSANRIHIGFFGLRNAGKSSLVNAVTGQDTAVVSDISGTTTDPVYKAMEILPLGPVMIIDTPGIDDEGALGAMRVGRTRRVLNKTDVAVLVTQNGVPLSPPEQNLINIFAIKSIPFIIAYNKSDICNNIIKGGGAFPKLSSRTDTVPSLPPSAPAPRGGSSATPQSAAIPAAFSGGLAVSAKTGLGVNTLKEKIAALALAGEPERPLVADLVKAGDFVPLIVPIDKAAPKGRLILPQQQVIRGLLEAGAVVVVVRDTELKTALDGLAKPPAMVITDSQVFAKAAAAVPPEIPLTSFSILFARYKGTLETSLKGAAALDGLCDGDTILICEGCTHHRQCDDIGTVKLPAMIRAYTGKKTAFVFCSGGDFPEDLSPYKIIIHCGACMLNEREVQYRRRCAEDQSIPFTNYGITIAHIQGILARSITVFRSAENNMENV